LDSATALLAQDNMVFVTRLEYTMTTAPNPHAPPDNIKPATGGKLVKLISADGRERQEYTDGGKLYRVMLTNYSTQTRYELQPATKHFHDLGHPGGQQQSHEVSKAANPPFRPKADSIAGLECVNAAEKPGPLSPISCKDPVTGLYDLARFSTTTLMQTVTFTLTKAQEHYVPVDSKMFDLPSDYTNDPAGKQ
jgi:hypothetical protein